MASRSRTRRLAVSTRNVVVWAFAALVWSAAILGWVGPSLGGSGPGLQGPVGFLSETIVAMWIPGGVLAAVAAVAALLCRLRWPAVALAGVASLVLVPAVWASFHSPILRAMGPGSTLRVATVNLAGHIDVDPAMEQCLRELDADVLVLPEFTSSWAAQLEEWLVDDYPHRWVAAASDEAGVYLEGFRLAVWSRLPSAGDCEVVHLANVNSQLRVPLRWRGRVFAVYGIHPRKPFPYRGYASCWRDRDRLLEWIGGETLPMVVAGDFNAPPGSAFLGRLVELGLVNASEKVCGRAPVTWPMQPQLMAPLRVAIDHVMHSDALVAVHFERGLVTRSDHAPVIAELTWRDH